MTNHLHELADAGQSIWIDDLSRHEITSGELDRLVERDRLRGVTSNPTIFAKALADDPSYAAAIRRAALRGNTPREIYDAIAIEDTRMAADRLRPVFDRSDEQDGFVSLEVSPHLAYDAHGTVEEVHRLWSLVARPNVMIKVPATPPGLIAIATLVADGININVTLLFALERYAAVAYAYLAGLEARERALLDLRVASVASFFVSRVDVIVDAELDSRERSGAIGTDVARRLRGRAGIANARLAHARSKAIFDSPRYHTLAALGARPQRVLWASTGTKNPAYGDVYYPEALIGADTIDTFPRPTLDAFRDHGHVVARLDEHGGDGQPVFDELEAIGIDLDAVMRRLEREGVQRFAESYDRAIDLLATRCEETLAELGDYARH